MKPTKKLVLASGSPRRAEILSAVGWDFEKHVPNIDESERAGETPEDYVCRLAKEKAEAIAKEHADAIVLGADTTVVLDGKIVGKPIDLDDARAMIAELSGKEHFVLTGVAVVADGRTEVAMQRTSVRFTKMNGDEIEFLVAKGDPLDKAGGYAVQAQAALFIEYVNGDYWNVVGLPINLVYRIMRQSELIE